MSDIYLWIVTAISAAVAANTLTRLWLERHRLTREDLQDDDRAFAWRLVIFLIFPLSRLVDLRSTIVVTQLLGGSVKAWAYGLFWYNLLPSGVPPSQWAIVLYAGVAVQIALAICLLPALFFRPHPFLATIIGYTATLLLGFNLVLDPLLSMAGMGSWRWQLVNELVPAIQRNQIFAVYAALAFVFVALWLNQRVRLWFAQLSRPIVSEELRDAMMEWRHDTNNPFLITRLGILYDKTGLRRQSRKMLKRLASDYPGTLYHSFLSAMINYRTRRYLQSREEFLQAADTVTVDSLLKANFLSAAACCAFGQGDLEGALNLCERALEFDDAGVIARMVKVDVFLRTDRKEQAGEEIVAAMRRGLDLDLEDKVPLDTDRALKRMYRLQVTEKKEAVASFRD